jgi:hypothetical protein
MGAPLDLAVSPVPDLHDVLDLEMPRDLHEAPDLRAADLARPPDLACEAVGPPRDGPTKLTFADTDPRCGELSGTIVVGHASIECDVTAYHLYWGQSATSKLSATPIATLPLTGNDLSYALAPQPLPAGATYLLAYAANDAGENATPAAVAIVESVWTDISAGEGEGSGGFPSVAIDTVNGKLLAVTADDLLNGASALFRCNLDGTGCAFLDISAALGSNRSGGTGRALIDGANSKLLDVMGDNMLRCNLDGTGCAYVDLSAGHAMPTVGTPAALIDDANGKLLSVLQSESGARPVLFRCSLDGMGCAFSEVSPGGIIGQPSAVIDTLNSKLLIVAVDASSSTPVLFRCNLDGTGCAGIDISVGQGFESGSSPQALIDTVNGKLLVVAENESRGGILGLFRCNLDGTGCAYVDISAGQGTLSGEEPSAVIDTASGKLLVAADYYGTGAATLALYSCNLDGSACTYRDISAGRRGCGVSPSAALDAGHRRLLVVTHDFSNRSRPSLFSVCLP